MSCPPLDVIRPSPMSILLDAPGHSFLSLGCYMLPEPYVQLWHHHTGYYQNKRSANGLRPAGAGVPLPFG